MARRIAAQKWGGRDELWAATQDHNVAWTNDPTPGGAVTDVVVHDEAGMATQLPVLSNGETWHAQGMLAGAMRFVSPGRWKMEKVRENGEGMRVTLCDDAASDADTDEGDVEQSGEMTTADGQLRQAQPCSGLGEPERREAGWTSALSGAGQGEPERREADWTIALSVRPYYLGHEALGGEE
jgi:hypothetical protein